MAALPNLLSALRLLCVPVLLTLAGFGFGRIFLALLIASLLTDALDGFFARKLKQCSEFGAKLDSWADLLTTLALPFCAWWLRPEVLREESAFLIVGLVFYFAAIAAGFVKFRRLTSYHTLGAKAAASSVAISAVVVFAGGPGWPLRVAMILTLLACTEEIIMTVMLKEWRANVPTLWHALKLRKTII
ncbi:MAG: CDP-alcohol phosphatidyltransferase family protein [Verrucomicrobia bacterium]|nr:MAG: CDP-alcohol phosphatidyltransferase family protein [Verrucomicrobiota bacterium]